MSVREHLERARRREKAQTLFYRGLAARAEEAGRTGDAERLNELHADEQHHLSRLTARLLELGASPADLGDVTRPSAELEQWESVARAREAAEVDLYESLLGEELDAESRTLLEAIVQVERQHRDHLGGKWTRA